jgi:rod shape-determining protein MreD|tara:strand:+ start:52 stop:528 length:477 start_codon:yes stop_codon:yes gene_type:complete
MSGENLTGPVILSLVIATVFQLIPASGVWLYWRPNFLLLVVIAWILFTPERFGIGFAGMVGLMADTLFHTTLGHYVLVFAVCGTIAYLLSRWLMYLSIFHRAFLIFVMIIGAESIQAMLFSVWGVPVNLRHIPIVAVFAALSWLVVDLLISRLKIRRL